MKIKIFVLLTISLSMLIFPNNYQKLIKRNNEIKKTIDYFIKQGNREKLKALEFLLNNIESKGYTIFKIFDKKKNTVKFNVLDYPDYNSMVKAWEKLEKKIGKIENKRADFIPDIEIIKSDFLIKNIELAFKAWKTKAWSKNYNFKEFCEYILPYRGSNESLSNWREYFFEKYKYLSNEYKNCTDPVKITILINNDIKSWFKFDARFYRHPTDQNFNEMMKTKMGRCEDMTNLAIYALRANGVAVVSDFTPYWAISGNNHAWNAVIDKNKKVIPFMGGLYNPGKYAITNRVAKVYRKLASVNADSLGFKYNKQLIPNRYLTSKNISDVTEFYTSVSNVSFDITSENKLAFLSVFNGGKWQAINPGIIKNKKVVFYKNGNNDLVYLPAIYKNKKLTAFDYPFILKKDGKKKVLKPESSFYSIKISSITKKNIIKTTEETAMANLKLGALYELYYWDFTWKKIDSIKYTGKAIIFNKIPHNSLLWLIDKKGKKEERIFIYKNNRQIWY